MVALVSFGFVTAGLEINPDRPDDKLPFRGVFYWLGPDMLHLMELPNPDPKVCAIVEACRRISKIY